LNTEYRKENDRFMLEKANYHKFHTKNKSNSHQGSQVHFVNKAEKESTTSYFTEEDSATRREIENYEDHMMVVNGGYYQEDGSCEDMWYIANVQ